jgi:hypothetical protein
VILLVLIGLAARVGASPANDPRAEAIRYANALTGVDPDPAVASGDDDDDDDALEAADDTLDDDENDENDENDDDGDDARNAADRGVRDDARDDRARLDVPHRLAPGGDVRPGLDARAGEDPRIGGDARISDDVLDDEETLAGMGGPLTGDPDDEPDRLAGPADGALDPAGDPDDEPDRLASLADRASDPAGDADDDPDRLASFADAASDPAGAALSGHLADELAMLDTGAADSGDVTGEDVSFAAASAGAAETYESWMRHQRPSPWGRLDLGVEWRRRWSEPMRSFARRYDEVWLVATWRR